MNHRMTRNVMVGIFGAALLVGLTAGTAANQDGEVALAPDETVVAAAAAALPDLPYLLSPPNEVAPEANARVIPVTGAPYRLSAPNERDPSGDADGSFSADQPGYRVSPPNEADPWSP